jgi:FAD/FMN-containing dehydrogenase
VTEKIDIVEMFLRDKLKEKEILRILEVPETHLNLYADKFGGRQILEKRYVVVRPKSASDVAKIFEVVKNFDYSVMPVGGATGALVSGGILPTKNKVVFIDTRSMNKILRFDPDSQTVTVQAGVKIAKLQAFLKVRGYWTPILPGSFRQATIGGAVCTNAISPFSTKYGRATSIVTALQIVFPNGKITEIGNKTSFDNSIMLKDFFLSSEGRLGILTEVTLKVYPFPESRKVAMFGFKNINSAISTIIELRNFGIQPETLMILEKERVIYEALQNVSLNSELNYAIFIFVSYSGSKGFVASLLNHTISLVKKRKGVKLPDKIAKNYWKNLTKGYALPVMRDVSKEELRVANLRYNSVRIGIPLHKLPIFLSYERKIRAKLDMLVYVGTSSYILLPQADSLCVSGCLIDDSSKIAVEQFKTWERKLLQKAKRIGGSLCAATGLGSMYNEFAVTEFGDSLESFNLIKRTLDPWKILK